MTYLRLARFVAFALPLFTLPACNHHTVMQLPRADAGPDAGWVVDFRGGEDVVADVPEPDASAMDLGRGDAAAAPDVGRAVDLGRDDNATPDTPARDAPGVDLRSDSVDPSLPPMDAPAVDGPLPALLVVEPTSAKLSAAFAGGQRHPEQPTVFSVQNTGATTTGALQIALTGPKATDFSIVSDTCSGVQLPAQGSCAVGIIYSPAWDNGGGAAALVATDTASSVDVTATLDGWIGQAHCLVIRDTSVDLGSVVPGAAGVEVRIAVQNFCDWADIGTVFTELYGPNPDQVHISTNTCTATLAPKGICMIGLQLVPPITAAPGTVSAVLTVKTAGGIAQVAITGTIFANSSSGQDAGLDADQGADTAYDASAFLFPELPSHTFQIAASNNAPDASAWLGGACKAPNPAAIYRLTFSADGTKVHIVRTDPVQEATLDGTLVSQPDTRLRYTINTGLGGALVVWKEGGTFFAQFELYGSGVPVVQCIQSPMTGA